MSGVIRSAVEAGARGVELDCDVVVVGSGAGGAVVATELALAGQRVIVLEEGPHVTAARYGAMRPSESLRHVWRDAGMGVAWPIGNSPAINVTTGKVVGGSSMLTGGVCFRVPESVHDVWVRDRHLPGVSRAEMDVHYDAVERAMNVEEVPAAAFSRGTELYVEGATKLGVTVKPMRRNIVRCQGEARCNFGCPHQAKMSVDQSYLPRALAAGAAVFCDVWVERIETRGERAIGVSGYAIADEKRRTPVTVRAKRVVVAGGGLCSPVLLARSGIANPQVGRHMTLHPSFRILARFDEPVRGWDGALQAAFVDAYEHERITMTGLFIPPGVLAATMPGVGAPHVRHARNLSQLAMFGGLVHDEGGGRVFRSPFSREPVMTYRMDRRDRETVPKAIRLTASFFFAAGAKEVFLPVLGMEPLDADALARFDLEHLPMRRFESSSQHPLGSCRMSADPRDGVVGPTGESWDVKDLYVADGSVMPTSLGVNPQEGIMAMATRIAWGLRELR